MHFKTPFVSLMVAWVGVFYLHVLYGADPSPAPSAQPSPAPISSSGPKYGPQATRLYLSHEYFRSHPAPDFWAMMPYYQYEISDGYCSAATVTMVVNAARAKQSLTASDELVTQEGVVRKLNDPFWNMSVADLHRGVTLDELATLLSKSLKEYGFTKVEILVNHVDQISIKTKQELHRVLVENEKSANDFVVLNFLQSEFTGDPEGAVGHLAPIGAYDAKKKQALILDPDRKWYEPYWVSEDTLLKGMATVDKYTNRNRGYLWIKLNK